ncbi:hypothetical protein [Micromonospora sp. WMMB235]|uniref:hypothetical protein n=1 Tax=Micromonospora sp. WMMB235 TaxID=1172030 RepID=UPI0008D95659|nr:hypothetical protein [Micromonospora sp. WMMB235]OHX01937.1 hypothetical protein BFV98_02525 [Micromonospora sp. WMMB235]
MGDLTEAEADAGGGWWNADDVADVTEMLAARRSRLWQFTTPADLAAWVFQAPEPSPLAPVPGAVDGDWAAGLDETGRHAWAFAGWVARTVVPEAAGTAGRYWILSHLDDAAPAMLRLTVGMLEILGLYETGEEVWLRSHAAPILSAIEAGAIDPQEWERRGIAVADDRTRTLAEDKVLLTCPDLATARWLLRQPPVIAGVRLLSCWVAAGPYSFEGRYRPEVVARAWQASQLLDGDDPDALPGVGNGFDRPYTGVTTGDLPAQRSFDADAYRAGVDEHDRLCRSLIAHLSRSGLTAGAGLAGVNADVAWRDADGGRFIAEVKSVVAGNEVEQLRLGLGQLLEYRHRLAARGVAATAVLLVSRCSDPVWPAICAGSGVLLLTGEEEPTWRAKLMTAAVG